jgi:hypothetical protein
MRHPHTGVAQTRASPLDVACGVVSTAVIFSGRHFALGREIQGIVSIPASAHVPWALSIGAAARRSRFCISAAAVALAARAEVLREFSPSAADGGAHYRISNRVVTLFRAVS